MSVRLCDHRYPSGMAEACYQRGVGQSHYPPCNSSLQGKGSGRWSHRGSNVQLCILCKKFGLQRADRCQEGMARHTCHVTLKGKCDQQRIGCWQPGSMSYPRDRRTYQLKHFDNQSLPQHCHQRHGRYHGGKESNEVSLVGSSDQQHM